MENPKKGKERAEKKEPNPKEANLKEPNQKESTTISVKSQLGECMSVWLLEGHPFDQRDYMISPSGSECDVPSEKCGETVTKRKLGPSDIKIDSKYLLDSQKSLLKLSELIKDSNYVELVDRMEDLIGFFLKGSPMGFLVEDLPLVIEIVEFFARNRSTVPKFSDFVVTIMSYAIEPPKVGKASEMLNCKDTLVDYFTLFAELLATFDEECFQLNLLEALDCLIIRRKLVDVSCVKLSFCHDAMEASQLPYSVGSLMETVPTNLYLNYLELALQMIWVSIKTGYLMIQTGIIEYVIWRLDPMSTGKEEKFSLEDLEGESDPFEYYRLIDKSSYLIWCLFAISSKYNVQVPLPKQRALWSLKYVFHRQCKKRSQKGLSVRNNLAAIITKLCAMFGEKAAIKQTGIVGDVAALAVATEIKPEIFWLSNVNLTSSKEDFVFKKLMLLCCCLFARDESLINVLEKRKVIEGVLRLLNPKTTLPWIPSQFVSLLFSGLRTLSEIVPKLPDAYLSSKGNQRLLATIKWITEEHFDQDPLLEALKTFCIIITCGNERLVEDAKVQGGVKVLIDVCFRLLGVTFMKLEHQDKLAKIFLTLERLFKNDKKVQEEFVDSSVAISVKLLQRILADSENDSKWNSNVLITFGGFLWEAVGWCSSSLKAFVDKSGIFLLLDYIESCAFPLQMFFLGILVDMTDEGETISHLLTWRGKKGSGILSLLIDIWRKEEFLNKVHRTKDGIIQDPEVPLMTEEQWYLTHQATGCHIYSPSIAEMACSVRPKVHALYQFLQCRYFTLTQIGESTYSLHMKMIDPTDQVYIPLIEHYLALKMGEIWSEVIRDALSSGVLPSSFDGHVICTLLDEKNKWACRIQTMQEEILMKNNSEYIGREKELYSFIKECQLPSALEALHELDYIARTSFRKFQTQKKVKQTIEMDNCFEDSNIVMDDFYHTMFLKNTNVTFMRAGTVWVRSEKNVGFEEVPPPVSPESCSDNRFENTDDI